MKDLSLGIDTGGTFTDALIYCNRTQAVLGKAKTPTTHDDLSSCVSTALASVLETSAVDPHEIAVVSVSTTLATNALVEDSGRPAGLVTIGFNDEVFNREGLARLLVDSPHIQLDGGHSSHGQEVAAINLEPLRRWLGENDDHLDGYAVASSFSVRNPDHELAAHAFIEQATGKPVTLSHHLSSKLNAPKRAVTALLNAQLVPIISDLLSAVQISMRQLGLAARLMIVRGDGSLVSSDFVSSRPIETVLSGPAASAVGAAELASMRSGIVVDVGGTTTDVAVIVEGRAVSSRSGAVVGGHETMVNAVRAHTSGIGGDSQVQFHPLGDEPFTVGPRRATPLVVAAMERPALLDLLREQAARSSPRNTDGVYLWLRQRGNEWTPRSDWESEILLELKASPTGLALEEVVSSGVRHNSVDRLRSAGVIGITAFTPTDAAHVLGSDARYPKDPAVLGARLLARLLDRHGLPVAHDEQEMSKLVVETIANRITEAALLAAADRDGVVPEELKSVLRTQKALSQGPGSSALLTVGLGVTAPITAVGAPASIFVPQEGEIMGSGSSIPEHHEVANAFGAAVATIRILKHVVVSAPRRGLFRVHVNEPINFYDLSAAKEFAERHVERVLNHEMEFAGAESFKIRHAWNIEQAVVEERQLFVEATLESIAEGAP